MFNEKQRLHFASAIIDAFQGVKSFILPVFLVFAANGFKIKFNSFESIVEWISTLVILAIFLIAIVHAIIKWLTFTYWIEEGELKTEYGLFAKSKRYVPIERIQSLNYHEGIIHRLFKLQQVSVETAGGSDKGAEVVLSAISKEVAQHFEIKINALRQHQYVVDGDVDLGLNVYDNIIYKITDKNLILHATTSNGTGVVLASIFALITQLIEYIPEDILSKQFSFLKHFAFIAIIVMILFAILIAWSASVVMSYLAYYNFTLTKSNGQIEITRGLIEKRKITIPIAKIQAVKIIESPIRQLIGYAQVAIEIASGSLTTSNEKKVMLLPFIKKNQIEDILLSINSPLYASAQEMIKSPKQARPLFYRKYVWIGIPIIVGLSIFVSSYFSLLTVLLLALLLLAYYQHKDASFSVGEQRLLLQYRTINRVLMFVERNKVQAVEFKQTPFQKRQDLYTPIIHVKGDLGGVKAKVPHLSKEDSLKIYYFINREQNL